MERWLGSLVACLVFAACNGDGHPPESKTDPTTKPSPELVESVVSAMDLTADPCQDFYRYACGGWIDDTELDPDETRRSRSFTLARDSVTERLDRIVTEAVEAVGNDSELERLRVYFGSCSDEEAIEQAGVTPLEPYFAQIDGVTDPSSLMRVLGEFHAQAIDAAFSFTTYTAPGSSVTEPMFDHVALPLLEKDAYLRTDEASVGIRDGYLEHVAHMLSLSGLSDGLAAATKVLALEGELAKVSLSDADRRNLAAIYHPTNLDGLKQYAPSLPWSDYLSAVGVGDITGGINIAELEYYRALDRLLTKTPLEDLRVYLRWCVLHATVDDLPKRFRDRDFEFFSQVLAGQREPIPRRELCLEGMRSAIPDAVGAVYVAKYFDRESREDAAEILQSIHDAFRDDVTTLVWLEADTRAWVLAKREATLNQIGYPDVWETYSDLALVQGQPVANTRAAQRFRIRKAFSTVGKPADRALWQWDAATVNAASSALNVINLPAGILQTPFYSRDYPLNVNYGSIGTVMGHELTHGFDDSGRFFGPDGVPGLYWSEPQIAKFQERTMCIKEQFDAYEIESGLHVNGALTLGENIADLGGLKLGFEAFARTRGADAEPLPRVADLTDEQLFFVAFAQRQCELKTEEQARLSILTDPHSPGRFRVEGPLSNLSQFSEAFSCQDGDAMKRAQPCAVW